MKLCLLPVLAAVLATACGHLLPDDALREDDAAWDATNLEALAGAVAATPADGLDVVPERLDAPADGRSVAERAEEIFLLSARRLSSGARPAYWNIAPVRFDEVAARVAMSEALTAHAVAGALRAFAPPHPQYGALKDALAATAPDDAPARARLALNMERWRWMPRDLGPNYVLVNIPSFEALLVRDGAVAARRRVIVGAPATPTRVFQTEATGVVFNPTWFVPQSIVRESVGDLMEKHPEDAERQGYFVASDGSVRQKPGPGNALGAMKLVMPNRYSIYLHDTPSKQLFKRENRALSHGCIRVEDAVAFAKELTGDADPSIDEALRDGESLTVGLPHKVPVYVAYFTAFASEDGTVRSFPDVYGLDEIGDEAPTDAGATECGADPG